MPAFLHFEAGVIETFGVVPPPRGPYHAGSGG